VKTQTLSRSLVFCAALATAFLSSAAGGADADFLGKQQIKIDSKNSEVVLGRVLGDIRQVFENYQPAVDSSTTVTSPVQVSGSSTHPFMQVTMKKCVFLFCETVEMKADITAREVSGKCDKNIVLKADISRSSDILSNLYDSLDFTICYSRAQDGTGVLDYAGSAHRAPSYQGGIVQGEVYGLMKLQVAPIGVAIKKALKTLQQ